MKSILLFLSLLLFLTGCTASGSAKDTNVVSDTGTDSEEKKPVASWESSDYKLPYGAKIIEDTLFYMEGQWEQDNIGNAEAVIYKKNREGVNAEEIVKLEESARLLIYVIDQKKSVYFLYSIDNKGSIDCYLKKIDQDGSVVFDTLIFDGQDIIKDDSLQRVMDVTMGEAAVDGQVCLSNANGDLFLFDSEGNLVCSGSAGWNRDTYHGGRCGLVNAGENGVFIYVIEGSEVRLQKVNLSEGNLEKEMTLRINNSDRTSLENFPSNNRGNDVLPGSLEIFNGYNLGILISDSDVLWRYDFSGDEIVKVLEWGENTVNLKGYMIDAIGVLPDASLYIMAHQASKEVVFVRIDYRAVGELPQNQLITLAVIDGYEVVREQLEEVVSEFNRRANGYQIEFQSFRSLPDLQMELIKGGGPDLLCLYSLDISVLAGKGVLENLSPFFEDSDIVKEEDLLPSIRAAGTINGEFLCVIPGFQVNGFWVEKGTTEKGGWSTEDFISLGEQHPDAAIMDYNPQYYHGNVLSTAIRADMDTYIDWKEKKCYFDKQNFINLVERVKKLTKPKEYNRNVMAFGADDPNLERFYQKELLTYPFQISSINPSFVLEVNGGHFKGDYAEIAGYPNESGRPYFDLVVLTPVGMNSASQEKEGAWEFLEYLLSEDYQNKRTSFPVRQDAFDRYLELNYLYGIIEVNLSDDDREVIRYMVNNAYWSQTSIANTVLAIISEETSPVWEGAKSGEEAAEIIQSRVSLFLQE